MKLLQIVLLFGSLTVGITILSGQSLTQDSCICYTETQDKRANECLYNKPKRDLLLKNALTQISTLDSLSQVDNQIISEKDKRLTELTKSLKTTNLKLKISKRLTFYGVPISFGVGIITSVLLFR